MCERRRKAVKVAMLVAWMALLGAPSLASAADAREQARQLFVAGKAHYAAGRYQQAVRAFQRAGKLRPSPILDFNIGRCHERLGQLAPAIAAYERYLRGRPKAGNRLQVKANIANLRRRLAARKPATDPYEDLEGGGGEGDGDHGAVTVVPPVAPAPSVGKAASTQPTGKAWIRLAPATSGIAMAAPLAKPSTQADIHTSKPGPTPSKATGPRPTPDPAKRRYASFSPRKASASPKRSPRAPLAPYKPRDEGPVYKQWWFWTAIGVGVLITGFVIGMAASGSDTTHSKAGGLVGLPSGGSSGATGLGLSF